MKLWPLLGLAALTCLGVDAPASLTNFVYYESGRTTARTTFWKGIVLEADGTARGLFTISTGPGNTTYLTTGPVTGTWTYTKGADGLAELRIVSPDESRNNERRRLSFTIPDSGTVQLDDNLATFGMTFQIAPVSSRSPLVNCSNRSFIPAGRSGFTGFVITGDRPRAVLIRAIGPTLRMFGITDALPDPRLAVVHAGQTVAENDDWQPLGGSSIAATGAFVGAFPLGQASKDAALVAMLPPGDYVAEASATNNTDSGQALIEVYVLP